MQTRKVGDCGLTVSSVGLGTMTWGAEPEQSLKLAKRFVSAGGNLFDTAPAYGQGRAEKILGKLLTQVPRDEVVIATKAGFATHGDSQTIDNSRGALLDDLAGSLRRLGTDYVDLWQIHAWGDDPLEETLSALDYAISTGMARYVGVCNFIGWQTSAAATWQRAVPGRAPLVSGQVEYSLLARRAELEILPALQYHQMGFFPWSPLGRGVLTGKYATGTPRDSRGANDRMAWFVEPYLDKRSRAVVNAVQAAADGLGYTAAQVALLWVRDAPGVTAPLLGARTVEQLDMLLEVDEASLPAEIVSALDDVTGGPNQLRKAADKAS